MSSTVESACVAVVAALDGQPGGMALTLCYDATDPWETRIALLGPCRHAVPAEEFDTDDEHRIVWYVGRELIASGLTATAGIGDVLVRPAIVDVDVIELELRNDHQSATLALPRADVEQYLAASYAVVPAGSERQRIDIDAHLALLLLDAHK